MNGRIVKDVKVKKKTPKNMQYLAMILYVLSSVSIDVDLTLYSSRVN